MLSITHMATGAMIARVLPNPLFYVPLVLASHFLEDWIPHWDLGTTMNEGKKSKRRIILEEIFELILGLCFIYITFKSPDLNSINIHIWLGALIGILPDLIEAPKNFLKLDFKFLRPINTFHEKFHSRQPDMIVGLMPQLVLLWIIYVLG